MANNTSFSSNLSNLGSDFRRTFGSSQVGRQFTQGAGEVLGWHYKSGKSMGWMGRKLPGGILSKGLLGRAFFPAFTAFSAYQGYKQGGVLGAAKNVAVDVAAWGAMRAAFSIATHPVGLAAAAVVGAGYGAYKLGEAAQKYDKRVRRLEMGADVVDRYGTLSTMRQRSLQAIQNSHLSGRLALGNEALLVSGGIRR